tara:strand:- start:217 stop:837 length:621 start_codon:yes stop_codon:yes gene_type:complete
MKQNLTLIIILFFLYSCVENKVSQKTDESLVNNTETKIITEDNDCNYSKMKIGENSSNTSQVKLIGLYENLENNVESTYGYSLMLWELDSEILGFLNFYEGGPEPTRGGPIVQGTMKNNIFNLKVWTKVNKSYEDWDKSDAIIYTLKIEKSENKLTGSLSSFNCTSKENGSLGDEKIELVSSDIWELNEYNNINEWKEEFSSKLDY